MITDEALTYLLTAAGEELALPPDGPADVLRATGPARPPRRRRVRRSWLAAAAVAVLVASAAGVALTGGASGSGHPGAASVAGGTFARGAPVKGANSSASGSGSAGSAQSGAVQSGPARPADLPAARGASPPPATNPAALSESPRVVKTGEVQLQAANGRIAAIMASAQTYASGLGGYVQSTSSISGPGGSGTEALRVPAAQFTALVNDVEALAKTTSVQVSGQDVTGQYVDLTARIAALESSRATYLSILAKATTIGDVLSVQQQIDSVQQQIEQLQGAQQVLGNESDYASLTVSVNAPQPAVAPPPSGLRRAFDASVHGFVVGAEDLLSALGPLLLAAVCLALLVAVGRLAWRLTRRRLV